MKKIRIMLMVLVFSLMMMGVAYAWWNETITVQGTAETGYLNVHFEETNQYPAVIGCDYVNGNYTVADKQLVCTFEDLYPSATGTIYAKVKNDSTIPVKFAKATISISGDKAALAPYLDSIVAFRKDNFSIIGQTNYLPINNLDDAFNNKLRDKVLQPGESFYFEIMQIMDSDAPNTTQDKAVTFTVTMDWQQFNQAD